MHEVFDAHGGNRIQRGTRLVHQDHVGPHGDGAGDAQPLLLATGQPERGLLELVFDLSPQRCLGQRLLDQIVHVGDLHAGDAGTVSDVVVDRLREGVGLLEHHADASADLDWVDILRVDVVVLEEHLSFDAGAVHEVVHPVQRAEKRGLAAAGGSDQGGDLVLPEAQVDVGDGTEVAIEDVDVLAANQAAGSVGHGVVTRGGVELRVRGVVGHVDARAAHGYHRFWNLLRMKMARAFMRRSTPSSRTLVAAANSWNPSCGRPVQLKIWMGRVVYPLINPLGSNVM